MLAERLLVLSLVIFLLLILGYKVDAHGEAGRAAAIQRFESTTKFDNLGAWSPATASVDWCERNYVVSYYIAEFYNTISNIILVLSGSHCMWQTHRNGWDVRFFVAGLSILTIGLGSMAYHATLLYWAQMWDEVPMVWSVLVFIYLTTRLSQGHSMNVAVGLAIYGSLWTVIHSMGAYVLMFQLHFGLIVLINLYLNCRALRLQCHVPILPTSAHPPLDPAYAKLRWMIWAIIVYSCLALTLWAIDQVACESLHNLPGGIPNPQLHAWWHILLGFSSHFLLQSSIVMRHAVMTKSRPATYWLLGGFLGFAAVPEAKMKAAAEQPGSSTTSSSACHDDLSLLCVDIQT